MLSVAASGVVGDSGSAVLIQEGAEQATYEEWNVRWERFDSDQDSGQDWWCRTMHEVHEGSRAIYCARNGYNSHYLSAAGEQPWNVNITDVPNSSVAPDQSNLVMRYDTNQDSIMRKVLVGASNYRTITVTFWFWSDTGVSDARQPSTDERVGYDFLNLIYYTGSGDEAVPHVAWTDSKTEAAAGRWIQKSVAIPSYATMVGFEFVSGTTAPQGGDSSNAFEYADIRVVNGGMNEGVYLDDIEVAGTGAVSKVPLATSVDGLAPTYNRTVVTVGYSANQPTVPLDYVNLYYRIGDEGAWTKYNTSEGEDQFRSSPISFNASIDGTYEFFTRGFDLGGNGEALRNAADASTIVDTAAPATNLTIGGTAVASGAYDGDVSVMLSATDLGTGADKTLYQVDDGNWIAYTGAVNITGAGEHEIRYYTTDRAGNTEAVRMQRITIVSQGGMSSDGWLLAGGGLAVVLLAVGVVTYRRRQR